MNTLIANVNNLKAVKSATISGKTITVELTRKYKDAYGKRLDHHLDIVGVIIDAGMTTEGWEVLNDTMTNFDIK